MTSNITLCGNVTPTLTLGGNVTQTATRGIRERNLIELHQVLTAGDFYIRLFAIF